MLRKCHRDLGFKYLRFHGLFNDDMSVVSRPMFSNQLILSFSNIDSIFDFLLSIGMKPFVELSFMPAGQKCAHGFLKSGMSLTSAVTVRLTAFGQAIWQSISSFIKLLQMQ